MHRARLLGLALGSLIATGCSTWQAAAPPDPARISARERVDVPERFAVRYCGVPWDSQLRRLRDGEHGIATYRDAMAGCEECARSQRQAGVRQRICRVALAACVPMLALSGDRIERGVVLSLGVVLAVFGWPDPAIRIPAAYDEWLWQTYLGRPAPKPLP